MNQIEGSTCVITGANSGIGKAAATEIARMGARVVMICRNRERGKQALLEVMKDSGSSSVDLILTDLSELQAVKDLAARLADEYPQIDVLVNNAGLFRNRREVTAQGHEMTFAVNHLAYFTITLSLLDTLRKSAPCRVINVASNAHRRMKLNFEDLQSEKRYNGWKAYGTSKLANILFTYELARRLEGTGVSANALHPGVVATSFGRAGNGLLSAIWKAASPFMLTPAQGARTVVHLATSPDVEGISGRYFANEKPVPSSTASMDTEAAARLWSESLSLAGFDEDPLPRRESVPA
ncbi:MAG: SDR family oxidoreductase [Rhodothermales bacterium]|nr:SDR family oxidoreductase [Rhodothermales bacterium]MBO6779101.1 SDR family oxidoreductase [Rhodothermales bacterium]